MCIYMRRYVGKFVALIKKYQKGEAVFYGTKLVSGASSYSRYNGGIEIALAKKHGYHFDYEYASYEIRWY